MTVEELIKMLNIYPPDCTVIMSSGDYPATPNCVYKTSKFDGYISPGMRAKRLDAVVVISGGF